MNIPSQILEEIVQITKAFRVELYDTLHDLADSLTLHDLAYGLNDSFCSIQDSLDNMQDIYLMEDMRDEYNQYVYV